MEVREVYLPINWEKCGFLLGFVRRQILVFILVEALRDSHAPILFNERAFFSSKYINKHLIIFFYFNKKLVL
jgi:hypothetical protein